MRHATIIILFVAALSIAGYILYIDNTGRIVATAELWSQQHKGTGAIFDALSKRELMLGNPKTQWIQSTPLHLLPEWGPLHIELTEVESGIVKKSDRRYQAEFTLVRIRDNSTVFHTPRSHITSARSNKSSQKIGPLDLGKRNVSYRIGITTVPETDDYALLARFDERFLVSSDQTLSINVYADKVEPNPRILAFFIVIMALSIGILVMTRTPDSTHWKTKQ